MRRLLFVVVALGLVGAACTGDGGGGEDEETFCATAAELAGEGGLAGALGELDLDDPAAAGDALRDGATRLRAWAEDATDDLATDIEALAASAEGLADAVAGGGPATLGAEARAELEALGAETTEASARVVADVERRCDVRLDAPPVAPATTTPSTAPAGG